LLCLSRYVVVSSQKMDVAVRRRGGHMVDATIVPVSRQRNSRDENEQVKAGITPEDWKRRPSGGTWR